MKLTMKLLMLLFGVLLVAGGASAESPREQLKQMVEQLQQNPGDNALREKIIKLAQELKPAPAVPEEARRYRARGITAFETAKSTEDFKRAVPEFQNAANVAPWWSDAYFNLAMVQEKIGDLKGAIASYRLYLAADPNAKDAESIRTQTYKLEFMAEQKDKEDKVLAEQKAKGKEARAREEMSKRQRQAWAEGIVQWLRQNYAGREVHYWYKQSDPAMEGGILNGIGRRFSYSIGGSDMDEIKIVEPTFDTTMSYCGIPVSTDVRQVKWGDCTSRKPLDIDFTAMTKNKHPAIVLTWPDHIHTIELEP